MNYAAIYESLVDNAKLQERKKCDGAYFERHHIIPRCFGGSNKSNNLVSLTAREHFIAHHLLVKIHQGHAGMQRAFWMMCHSRGDHWHMTREYRVTSSVYDKARADFSILARDVMLRIRPQIVISESGRKRQRQALLGNKHTLGYKHTDASKAKIREAGIGRKRTAESIAQGVANRPKKVFSAEDRVRLGDGMRGKTHTEETKALMSDAHKGRVKSPEHRERLRQALLGRKRGSWFTDGARNTIAKECPEGFWPGKKSVFGAVVEGEPGTN